MNARGRLIATAIVSVGALLTAPVGASAETAPLTAPVGGSAETAPLTARCGARTAGTAGAKPRDCTIRGAVDGQHIGPGGPGVTVSWHGELVLSQELVDPVTKQPPSQPTFAVSAGSTISWQLTGTPGDCTDSGSGTLAAADLTGDLTVTEPQDGKWMYSLDVGPRTPRSSADRVMPYTQACPGLTTVDDASLTEGLLFGYNGRPPTANMITAGLDFTGNIAAPGTGIWNWRLKGEVFPQNISEHGIAFIKAREGLKLKAYQDQLNLCTIGYGHLILPEGLCGRRASMHWTRQRAEAQLREDLDTLIEPYVRKASIRLGMDQCEYDALTSFAYNVAHGRGGESRSWQRLMAGATPSTWRLLVQERLPTFVHGTDAKTGKSVEVPDLVKRRAKELHMFSAPTCPCDGVAQ